MKVLYISSTAAGMHSKSIYLDLMNEFLANGHDVTIAYAREKRMNQNTQCYTENNINYLGIRTGNMTKNQNLIEKGIATLTFDSLFHRALKKYYNATHFDIILFSTPPITFEKTLNYLRKNNPNALFYLMLKDIFPQNAVDLGIMKKNSLIYKYFKRKEFKLYEISDKIGVMSPANYDYLLNHSSVNASKVEVLPNTITISSSSITASRQDFKLPSDKKILLFGGNLGLPQSVPFMLRCFDLIKNRKDCIVVVAGSGAQAHLLEHYIRNANNPNVVYLENLDNSTYNQLTSVADVGLIFLDKRFTIPNFPQKILSYMESKLPILCATDDVSDVGTLAMKHQFGFKVSASNPNEWYEAVIRLIEDDSLRHQMGENAYNYLKNNFTSDKAYEIIIKNKEVS